MADTKTKAASGTKTVKKAASPRKAPAPKRAITGYASEERYKMIQDAAYFIAERSNFAGDPHAFWLEAEAQISAL